MTEEQKLLEEELTQAARKYGRLRSKHARLESEAYDKVHLIVGRVIRADVNHPLAKIEFGDKEMALHTHKPKPKKKPKKKK